MIILVALSFTAFYFYKKSNTVNQESKAEINNLIDKVSKHVLLPVGETPTIATVSDPSLLKDQTFFVDTVAGDKVLMYTNGKKAILYRPSIDRIVNITVIDFNASTPSSNLNATTTSKTSIKKNSN